VERFVLLRCQAFPLPRIDGVFAGDEECKANTREERACREQESEDVSKEDRLPRSKRPLKPHTLSIVSWRLRSLPPNQSSSTLYTFHLSFFENNKLCQNPLCTLLMVPRTTEL